ncbi:hypothetical protein DVT68_16235 [Dyella solisilvae]|uniref:Beta-galactosidase n=1 Tax=Dyella solisilvae TaxID=1920168 RepID=A0A370K4C7_9GAMM|nr:DUF5597 domain-containing protein [Dyella solisilvae]RDI97515.1 hypothetical protein DVT68_16235 [Dyella solisilvae]
MASYLQGHSLKRIVALFLRLSLFLSATFLSPALLAQNGNLPRLERHGDHYQLQVDGKPYFILGAQVHNSNGFLAAMDAAWPVLHAMHCNTVSLPVYWDAIEPKEGTFDFTAIDAIIKGARIQGLHLALLWFGTWKNGAMTYVPSWVKENPARFPLVLDATNHPVQALSPMSDASRDADRTAFARLMAHLKEFDGTAHTVILIQVENEAGVLGADRDYSAEATASFKGPVPAEALASLRKTVPAGSTWIQVFAERAPEAFMSYWTARYIGSVAEAGKAVYPLPMYVNVWPREQPGLLRPGFSSPSGGAVAYLLAMWKQVAPAIDIIGPDIYDENFDAYRDLLTLYSHPDNALFVPETGGSVHHAENMFMVFAAKNAIGISTFGVDAGLSAEDLNSYKGWGSENALNYALLGPAANVWRSLSDAGHVQAAIEQEGVANLGLGFDAFDASVRFGAVTDGYGGPRGRGNPQRNGRVLIGQLGPSEFLIAGMNANIIFATKLGAPMTNTMLLSVEEGHFEEGDWKVDRLLNGDETAFGLRLPAHGQTLKVRVRAY